MTTKYKENPVLSTISGDFNPSFIQQLNRFQNTNDLAKDEIDRFNSKNVFTCKFVSLILTSLFICAVIIIVTLAGTIPCSFRSCNANAVCKNYPFFAKCECVYGFSGNGREYCDECGVSFYPNNLVRIVGGEPAKSHSWPSAVYINLAYKTIALLDGDSILVEVSYSCGGTLINRKTVLTAGHCILTEFDYDYLNKTYKIKVEPNAFYPKLSLIYKVYIGADTTISTNIDIKPAIAVSVDEVILHEKYNQETTLNDIALLKLTQPVQLNKNVQITCLPSSKLGSLYPPTNITAYAVGWGLLGENDMPPLSINNVAITVYNDSLCEDVSPNTPKNWDSQICAGEWEGGKDTCQGDSGGSIFVRDYINGKLKYISAGITSYGDGCARPNLPGIYTRISYFYDWIMYNSYF